MEEVEALNGWLSGFSEVSRLVVHPHPGLRGSKPGSLGSPARPPGGATSQLNARDEETGNLRTVIETGEGFILFFVCLLHIHSQVKMISYLECFKCKIQSLKKKVKITLNSTNWRYC